MKPPSGSSTTDQGTVRPGVKVETVKESCVAGCRGVGLGVGVGLGDGVAVAVADGEEEGEGGRRAVPPAQAATSTTMATRSSVRRGPRVVTASVSRFRLPRPASKLAQMSSAPSLDRTIGGARRVVGLRCRECGAEYPLLATHVCERCFGPLDVAYDYDQIRATISRERIEAGPKSIWRYRDLLPVEDDVEPVTLG